MTPNDMSAIIVLIGIYGGNMGTEDKTKDWLNEWVEEKSENKTKAWLNSWIAQGDNLKSWLDSWVKKLG